ncbi:MAG: nucleotidyltransferase family protein [Pseudomonadota bacterium]
MRIDDIALIVLASGLSRRFESGDKLMAPLQGLPLCAHIADTLGRGGFATRIAVYPSNTPARREVFHAAGFECVANVDPAAGQGASLALGAKAVSAETIKGVMVVLADMPFIGLRHCEALISSIGDAPVAVSVANGVQTPPVLFAGSTIERLGALSGDEGAKSVLRDLPFVAEIDLDPAAAFDIDTVADLVRAEAMMEAAA